MTRGRIGSGAVVAALVAVLAVPAGAQPVDAPPTGPPGPESTDVPTDTPTEEDVAVAEIAALSQAREVVASRMVASARAEGDRRRAEEDLVAAHRQVARADDDLAHVATLLQVARRDVAAAAQAQRAAQDVFDTNVATSYKYGGASSTALLLTALQSARDAHDLARTVDELSSVLGHSYDDLARHIRVTELARRRVATFERLRDVAAAAVVEAEERIDPVAEVVARTRGVARAREAELLDAAARALAAEQAALDAGALPEDLLDEARSDPLAPGTAPVEGELGPTVEQRAEWLRKRVDVLAGQARLPVEAWALQRSLTCPVAGATFGNDFHFPRSHGRRHLGTDVFADAGTPIVSLGDGVVTAVDSSDAFDGEHDLGGISVAVTTSVGRFYAAHMQRVADGLEVGQQVEAGDVLGYVGDTGNARGGAPHLHLGWYVDDVAVNPWPTLEFVCHPDVTT